MDHKQYQDRVKFLQSVHPDTGGSAIRNKRLQTEDDKLMLDIIVPAYNVEKYIDDCISSILKQKTHYLFRTIIVDDGSSDSTGSKIDKYQGRDNVLIIHQSNGGLSAARNTGLKRSSAKYVMFADSDDSLPKFAVEKMLSKAESSGADIVAGSYCNFKVFNWIRKEYRQKEGQINNVRDLKGHAWAKVIRRNLFDKVQFPEKYWFEDSIMHQIIYPNAATIVGIKDLVYNRRINVNSITHSSAGNVRSLDSLWVTVRLMEDRDKLNMQCTDEYYEYLLDQVVLTQKRLSKLDAELQENAFYVMSYQINERFPKFSTSIKSKLLLEKAIKNEDFGTFVKCISAK